MSRIITFLPGEVLHTGDDTDIPVKDQAKKLHDKIKNQATKNHNDKHISPKKKTIRKRFLYPVNNKRYYQKISTKADTRGGDKKNFNSCCNVSKEIQVKEKAIADNPPDHHSGIGYGQGKALEKGYSSMVFDYMGFLVGQVMAFKVHFHQYNREDNDTEDIDTDLNFLFNKKITEPEKGENTID